MIQWPIKEISDYHHYSANRDNIAENKYDGLSTGVHSIDFLINKMNPNMKSDGIPDSCQAELIEW
jgi:hypothetical protein